MREFLHEFIGHYVALEGPLWRSLWALLFQPGRLTLEYFAGRRRRFVQPLRLYLSLSFLFFIGLHLMGDHGLTISGGSAVQVQHRDCDTAGADCGAIERRLMAFGQRLSHAEPAQIQARVDKYSPYALLLMQPAFAGLLALVFWRRHMKYAEHFVFALHVHAFWFLAVMLGIATAWAPGLMPALMTLYAVMALRRVYHVSWWGGIWRALLLTLLYLPLLAAGAAALVIATTLLAGH